jgi:hypothetical protein
MASATPGACASGGGTDSDPVSASFFPRVVGAYCIDPHGETRTYGEQGKLDMEAVCTTAFDGECAIYNQLGLKRLVSLHYVNGAAGGGTVEVNLSRFADAVGAYAMFTKRVVADGDPIEPTTPKPVKGGAAAALGTGRAYVYRDTYLAELQYNNEEEAPEVLVQSSAKVLTLLAAAVGGGLPGTLDLPASVRSLPTEHRIVNGVSLVPKDALGIVGLAPLGVGYYADGAKRYRVVSLASKGEAEAKEAWKVVRARPGALPVAGLGDEAVALTLPTPAHSDYVFARKGSLIVGAGDEDLAADKRVPKDDKVALVRAALAAPSVPLASP